MTVGLIRSVKKVEKVYQKHGQEFSIIIIVAFIVTFINVNLSVLGELEKNEIFLEVCDYCI